MDRRTQSVALEKRHVHDVYNRIAPHFTDTRYKAWPRVKEFLLGLEPGSIVADVGCGNGKYLGINKRIYKVGSDCCSTLVSIAHRADHETMVCDNIRLPYRDNSFDAVISIAVIHHFATTERRAQALTELARICRPGGQIMIYVWAMEQKHRKFDAQDVLVPWHLQPKTLHNRGHSRTFQVMKNGFLIKGDPRTKSKREAFAAGKSSSYPANCRRAPFIPSHHSTEMDDGGFNGHSKIHPRNSYLPLRACSLDDVFLNISTGKSGVTCKEVTLSDFRGFRSLQVGSKKMAKSPAQLSYKEKVPPEDTSLLGSLTSTATQLLRAISRQGSLEVDKPTDTEAEPNWVEMSTFNKSVDFSDDTAASFSNGHKNIEASFERRNCHSQGSSLNGSIKTLSEFSMIGTNSAGTIVAPSHNGFQTDEHNGHHHDNDMYNSRTKIPMKPVPTGHPVAEISPATAYGESFKSHSLRYLPQFGQDHEDSFDSVSSSDDSLTAYPVEMKTPSDSPSLNSSISSEQTNGTSPIPSNPSLKIATQTEIDIFSNSSNIVDNLCVKTLGNRSDFNSIQTEEYPITSVPTASDQVTDSNSKQTEAQPGCNSLADDPSQKSATGCQSCPSPPSIRDSNGCRIKNDQLSSDESSTSSKILKKLAAASTMEDPSLFLRYYHVFREGELVDLIEEQVDSLHILQSYYDHANWCVVAEKVQVWTI